MKIEEKTLKQQFEEDPHYEYECDHFDFPKWKEK